MRHALGKCPVSRNTHRSPEHPSELYQQKKTARPKRIYCELIHIGSTCKHRTHPNGKCTPPSGGGGGGLHQIRECVFYSFDRLHSRCPHFYLEGDTQFSTWTRSSNPLGSIPPRTNDVLLPHPQRSEPNNDIRFHHDPTNSPQGCGVLEMAEGSSHLCPRSRVYFNKMVDFSSKLRTEQRAFGSQPQKKRTLKVLSGQLGVPASQGIPPCSLSFPHLYSITPSSLNSCGTR